jgi:hypothetical protein
LATGVALVYEQWCAGSLTAAALVVEEADFDAEALGFLALPPPGRKTSSSEAMSAAASTADVPASQRLRSCLCLARRASTWRRYRSLACLRWRSFLPATGEILLGPSHYPAIWLVFTGGRPTNPFYTPDRER